MKEFLDNWARSQAVPTNRAAIRMVNTATLESKSCFVFERLHPRYHSFACHTDQRDQPVLPILTSLADVVRVIDDTRVLDRHALDGHPLVTSTLNVLELYRPDLVKVRG